MTDRERAQVALLAALSLTDSDTICIHVELWEEQVAILETLIRTIRRETWEEAAKEAEQRGFGDAEFVKYCHAKAKEITP